MLLWSRNGEVFYLFQNTSVFCWLCHSLIGINSNIITLGPILGYFSFSLGWICGSMIIDQLEKVLAVFFVGQLVSSLKREIIHINNGEDETEKDGYTLKD